MKPSRSLSISVAIAASILLAACAENPVTPITSEATRGTGAAMAQSLGPASPNFNLDVILTGQGVGLVKFRQLIAGTGRINLDIGVSGLAPNTSYLLQRAVDTVVDENCTSTAWLTLGKGLQPQSITTDATGTGRAELYRIVTSPAGSTFDIHFQVINAVTSTVVLTSDCYQFTVR